VDDFTNLLHREIIKRGQTISYIILYLLSSRLLLGACGLQLFSFFFWPSTLKPSGDCLPASQGLRVINSVLDPVSHFNTTTIRQLHSYLSVEIRYWLKLIQLNITRWLQL